MCPLSKELYAFPTGTPAPLFIEYLNKITDSTNVVSGERRSRSAGFVLGARFARRAAGNLDPQNLRVAFPFFYGKTARIFAPVCPWTFFEWLRISADGCEAVRAEHAAGERMYFVACPLPPGKRYPSHRRFSQANKTTQSYSPTPRQIPVSRSIGKSLWDICEKINSCG